MILVVDLPENKQLIIPIRARQSGNSMVLTIPWQFVDDLHIEVGDLIRIKFLEVVKKDGGS